MKRFVNLMTVCLLVAASATSFTACSKDSIDLMSANDDAPQLPSQSTMLLDLSFFGVDDIKSASQQSAQADAMLASAGNHSNWIQAVVRVIFLQLSLYDALEEPVGAFAAAINAVPQAQSDGSYLWTFIFVDEGVEYGIFLYGIQVGNRVEWRMEVSSNNPTMPLDHFVWFDGESMIDESGGYWQFYMPVDETAAMAAGASMTGGVPVVRMDWEHNGPKDNALTIVNNQPGGEDEGDRLEFRETPGIGTIDFDDAGTGEHHNIAWLYNGSGSITVPDYNNGETACWDIHQENTMCP